MPKTAHNPNDHGFKDLAEFDPRALLHLTGRLPITAQATITKVGPEVLAPGKLADYLAIVESDQGDWLDHTEAVTWWGADQEQAITERVMTAMLVPSLKHLGIGVNILLMDQRGAPVEPKVTLSIRRMDAVTHVTPRWFPIWTYPAQDALALGRERMLALVPLMEHSESELDEAGRRLVRIGDPDMMVQFLLFASRKYDSNELRRRYGMFERATIEIAKTTWLGQDIMRVGMEAGREEGLQEGREEGREEGLEEGLEQGRQRMLDSIRRALRHRFPGLAEHGAINEIPSMEAAQDILDKVYMAETEAAALAAIVSKPTAPPSSS